MNLTKISTNIEKFPAAAASVQTVQSAALPTSFDELTWNSTLAGSNLSHSGDIVGSYSDLPKGRTANTVKKKR